MKVIEKFIELLNLNTKEISSQDIKNQFSDIDIPDEIIKFWSISDDFMIDYASFISPFSNSEFFQETIEDLAMNFNDAGLAEYVEITENSEDRKKADAELISDSEIPNEVQQTNYNKKWLPVFCNDGIYVFFDFAPTELGQKGQLIVKDIMSGDASITLVPYSLDELLKVINEKIIANELITSDYSGTKQVKYKNESKFIFNELFSPG